mgnify:CR=1 FL=1
MENTSKQEVVQPKEKKQSNSIVGLLVGVVSFLFLLVILGIIFIFTDLGNALVDKVQEIKNVESVERETEEESAGVEEVTLDNDGWSLYSIPEYGFSVEIPDTTEAIEYDKDDNLFVNKRWEIARMDMPDGSMRDNSEIVEEINIDYSPTYLPRALQECAPKCTGDFYITMYIYNTTEDKNLDNIIAEKEIQFDDFVDSYPGDINISWEDYYKYDNTISEGSWCVVMPNMAGDDANDCYIETEDYLFEVTYGGDSRISGEILDVQVFQEAEKIVNSMKLE